MSGSTGTLRDDPGEELVEEIDEHGAVVRIVTRRQMRQHGLRHRAVYVVVTDSTGRVLVHRRSEDKDVWSGRWDLAAGGVVGVGEHLDAAARRELAEELGIDTVPERLGPCRFDGPDVRVVGHVYRCVHDGPLRFADGEVIEAVWVTPAELRRRLAADSFVPDSPVVVLPYLRV